jgi:hypothetical protein
MTDITREPPDIEKESEALDDEDEELNLILDYLMAHKMAFSQDFLRAQDLPFSGTKAKLRERLEGYVRDGQVSAGELVDLLNRIEGWGNQHIYLYLASNSLIAPWRKEESIKQRLDQHGLGDLLNRPRPLLLPEGTTLASVNWTPQRLQFVWVEKRQWEERLPSEDYEEEDILYKAYRQRTARGLTTFDWDLISGHAMLMIQRLHRGARYPKVRQRFEDELEPIVDLRLFSRLLISRAIQPIEDSGEVRARQLDYETRRGGRARFTSSSTGTGTHADPDLHRADQALGQSIAGWLGNFYWLTGSTPLQQELHVKLYGYDQRVGIFGEQPESEVRYVLSRIRHYCL